MRNCLIVLVALAATGCATTPPPAPTPVVQQPKPEPVDLPKPALLDKIPVFAPPPSPAVDSYHNTEHLLPLKEYISAVKRSPEKRLPYKR